jgi:hypothetical protein
MGPTREQLSVFPVTRARSCWPMLRGSSPSGGEWVNPAKQHPGFRSAQRFHSTQRLRIRVLADGGGVEVATYPAELVEQARYLYGGGLGPALVDAARERGWKVEPSPHIAFWRASPGRRLYVCPPVDALRYVACTCALAFDSAASGNPSQAPRSLRGSATILMPCSLLRMSRRCVPQAPVSAHPNDLASSDTSDTA